MLEQYIGTKIIKAEPMNLGDYNEFKGWTIPEDEDPNKEGYLVKYSDDYISWSPKEAFEDAYRKSDGMNFGLALEALKHGCTIRRSGWNGKGMYLFLAEGCDFNTQADISEFDDVEVEVHDTIVMKTAQDTFVVGWLASQTDMLSDDWQIVNYPY